jgi:hypothetical protein
MVAKTGQEEVMYLVLAFSYLGALFLCVRTALHHDLFRDLDLFFLMAFLLVTWWAWMHKKFDGGVSVMVLVLADMVLRNFWAAYGR